MGLVLQLACCYKWNRKVFRDFKKAASGVLYSTIVSSKHESKEGWLFRGPRGLPGRRGACPIAVQGETEKGECCKIYSGGRTNRTKQPGCGNRGRGKIKDRAQGFGLNHHASGVGMLVLSVVGKTAIIGTVEASIGVCCLSGTIPTAFHL